MCKWLPASAGLPRLKLAMNAPVVGCVKPT